MVSNVSIISIVNSNNNNDRLKKNYMLVKL